MNENIKNFKTSLEVFNIFIRSLHLSSTSLLLGEEETGELDHSGLPEETMSWPSSATEQRSG